MQYIVSRFLDSLRAINSRFTEGDVVAALHRDAYGGRMSRFLTDGSAASLHCLVLDHALAPNFNNTDMGADAACLEALSTSNAGAPLSDRIKFTSSLAGTHHAFTTVVYAVHMAPLSEGAPLEDLGGILFGTINSENPAEEFLAIANAIFLPLADTLHEAHLCPSSGSVACAPLGYADPYQLEGTVGAFEASREAVRASVEVISRLRDEAALATVVSAEQARAIAADIPPTPMGAARALRDEDLCDRIALLFSEWTVLLSRRDAKEKCAPFYATKLRGRGKQQRRQHPNGAQHPHGGIGIADGAAPRPAAVVDNNNSITMASASAPFAGADDGDEAGIDFQQVPENYSPSSELEAWRAFEVSSRSELDQIASGDVQSLLQLLEHISPAAHRQFASVVERLRSAAAEALIVLRHLPTIVRASAALASADPAEAVASVADVGEALELLINAVPYYRERDHLTLLCLSITNQAIVCAKAAIRRNGRVWDQADSIPMLRTLLRHFEGTAELSRSLREELIGKRRAGCEGGAGGWEDNSSLLLSTVRKPPPRAADLAAPTDILAHLEELTVFGKLELFCTRLSKMHELFGCVLTYRVLSEYHLDGIEGVLTAFFANFSDFRRKSGDCLDYTKPAFDRDFFEFKKKIVEGDRSLQVYVNFSFEKLSNTVASLELLQKYQVLMQRDSLKADLQAKYLIMFQRYGADVETIQRTYEQHKADPPPIRHAPPIANRILWARHLLRRIEEPMQIFQACHSVVTHQRDISKVIRLYNRVALTVTRYEAFYASAWAQTVGMAVSGRHATVLVRDEAGGGGLYVNFDPALAEIAREARWMVSLGVEVPAAAKDLLQHRELPKYVSQLTHLVHRAGALRGKIDPLHLPALQPVLAALEASFAPGLTAVTWASATLPYFVSAVADSLDAVELLVGRINGIVDCRITPSMRALRGTNVMAAMEKPQATAEDEEAEMARRRAVVEEAEGADAAEGSGQYAAASQGVAAALSANPATAHLYTPQEYLAAQLAYSKKVSVAFAILNDTVRQASIDLCQLIEGGWEPRAQLPGEEDALTNLYSHYNRLMFKAVLHSIVSSLGRLNRSIAAGASLEGPGSAAAFLAIGLELLQGSGGGGGGSVLLSPSTDELQAIVNECVASIVGTSKCLGEWPHIRGMYSTSEPAPFFLEVSRNKETMKTVLLLTGSVFALRRQLTEFSQSFDRFSVLWLADCDAVVKGFSGTYAATSSSSSSPQTSSPASSSQHRPLSQYEEELRHCKEVQRRAQLIEDACLIGCVSVDCSLFKGQLLAAVGRWRRAYGQALHTATQRRLVALQDRSDGIYKRILHGVSEDFERLPAEMGVLDEARTWEWRTESALAGAEAAIGLLEAYCVGSPSHLSDLVLELRGRWRRIHTLAMERWHAVGGIQYIYKRDLINSVLLFGADIIAFRNNFESNGPLVAGVAAEEGVARTRRFQRLLDDKMRRWQAHMAAEAIFHYPQHLYPELALTVKEMSGATRLYSLYTSVMRGVAGYRGRLWRDVDYAAVVEELTDLHLTLKRLPAALKQFAAYKEARAAAELYIDMEPIVAQLSQRSIKQRHWREVMGLCGAVWSTDPQEMLLAHVVDANLLPHKEEISDIALSSEREGEIEARLAATAREWREYELSFANYKQRGPVTLKADDTAVMRERLEDALVVLGSLLASKFIAPFRAEAQMWLHRLTAMGQSLALVLEVQAAWMYLEAVFAGGDIMKQMPQESKRFAMIDRQWVKLVYKAADIGNAVDFCCGDDVLKGVPYLKDQLDVCQRALSSYLEQKRGAFPRFYFVSDAILLEILSQGSDANAMQPHLQFIFDGLTHMTLRPTEDRRQSEVLRFSSAEGESVAMAEPMVCSGNVEVWLDRLVTEMQRSVRVVMREAVGDVDNTRSDPQYFGRFIHRFPSQVVLTALQIRFTADVHAALEGTAHGRKELSRLLLQTKEALADQARQPSLTDARKVHIESLTIMAVHNSEIWESAVRRAANAESFDWQRQVRFYWSDAGGCDLLIADAGIGYCYEYLGIKERLVITPLTDRCYVTLSQALAMGMGGAPAGPAGTGKTETVKDLGRAAGKYVVVFNCSDQWDVRSLGKIFKGLAQSGAWGCFDEFNRITLPVLSVVSQQLSSIFNGLRHRREEFLMPSGEACRLNSGVGIFVTMNPGYAGRTELPENLKALFRGVSMMVPDSSVIMRTKLAANGYKQDAALSRKFNMLYLMCRQQLSDQRHYDFGLRNILSVLRSAGNLLRRSAASGEEAVFIKCVRDINLSKMVREDVPVFKSLLADIFPGAEPDASKHTAIEAAITAASSAAGLTMTEAFMLKCLQIYDTKLVRHGIMVVGPAGSGKSACMATLIAALTEAERKHREVRMNPKAITVSQMFGLMDSVTGDWTDGIFSYLWRRSNREAKQSIWIVCDGPVDTLWIESLNTVLDDNKLLTLANGDRILMAPTVKMCFEVANLENASPATVSRAGIIYVSPDDIGWAPVFTSLVGGLADEKKWSADVAAAFLALGRTHLPPLFDALVLDAKSYLGLSLQHFASTLVQIAQPLLETLTEAPADATVLIAEGAMERVTEMSFWYAAAWAFGGSLDAPDRLRFLAFAADRLPSEPVLPEGKTIFEVFVNPLEARWELWGDHVPRWGTSWDPSLSYVDCAGLFVPTVEATIMHSLLANHLNLGRPAMLVGLEGAAKTVTMETFLRAYSHDDDHRSWSKVNISRATTPQMLQSSIEDKCEKRMGTLFGPKRNRQLALFLDDLNMSNANEWGDQAACELLRQIMEQGGVFSLSRIGEWKRFTDLRFFGAMAASTTVNSGGSASPGTTNIGIPPRLLRHFAVYSMPFPQHATLMLIYGSLLTGRFGNIIHLRNVVPSLVEATLHVWRACATTLLPTPTRFHYSFNLRDLSRIVQGLMMCTPSEVPSQAVLARLWHHECARVLSDKLSHAEDVLYFNKTVAAAGRDFFGADAIAGEEPHVANFCRDVSIDPLTGEEIDEAPRYEIVEAGRVRAVLEGLLASYAEQKRAVKVDVVLFTYAMRHLLRIARILGTPRGSALLVGVGGSGKQSLTRLAAYSQRQTVFSPTVTASYTMINWLDDLRTRYMVAATQGPTTYMLTDAHIREEGFLEHINAALSSGDVPGLFNSDEREGARSAIRHIARQTARREFEDSEEWLWGFFLNRVRENLHFVLCFSPEGGTFRRRFRQFPGLVASCTIDYFFPWPNAALCDVAASQLAEVDLKASDHVKRQLPRLFAEVHSRCDLLTEDYFVKHRQRVYLTPEVYLTFLRCFGRLYSERRATLSADYGAVTGGLQKLGQAADDVAAMRALLDEKEAMLRAAQEETEVLLADITVKTAHAERQAADVQAVADVLSKEAARIEAIRAEAERDLLAAQPAVEAAKRALDLITPSDIHTLKSMQRPPELIRRIFDGVGILLLNKIDPVSVDFHKMKMRIVDSWVNHGRPLCGSMGLLDRLIEFNNSGKDKVNDETCELLEPYLREDDFTFERAKTASGNIAGLCTWVRAMVAYRAISKFVAPKIEALRLAEGEMRVANAKLAVQREALERAQAALARCNEELAEARARRDQLAADAEATRRRVGYATSLIDALGDERARWMQQAQSFEATLNALVGCCVAAAAFVTYAGPYNPDYRGRVWRECAMAAVAASGTPVQRDLNFIRFLTDEQTIAQWQLEGLPMDDHSVQSALIIRHSLLFPLLVDPQTQALGWLRQHLSASAAAPIGCAALTTVAEKGFAKLLERQLAAGLPLLVEDAQLDGRRNQLLLSLAERRQARLAGRGLTLSVLGESYDYNPLFKLYMFTRSARFAYVPEVFAKVAVIDFSVTMHGLEQQLLARVVRSERSELETQRVGLMAEINANERKLRAIEDELLHKLSSVEGSLVDDETLILTLQHSKASAQDIKDTLAVASDTRARIAAARSEYQGVSIRAAVLYFTSVEMANVNYCYQLSLERFTDLFDQSMRLSPAASSTAARIVSVNEMATYLFFKHVGRGLFEPHKLLFSLLIVLRIELQAGTIDAAAFTLFAKGGAHLEAEDLARAHPKPFAWVPMSTWKNIVALSALPKLKFVCEALARNEAEFRAFAEHEAPEALGTIPGYDDKLTGFEWLCAVRCLREDRALVAAAKYITDAAGPHLVEVPGYTLADITDDVAGQRTPILFLLSAGSEPTALIEAEAKQMRRTVVQLSLGQGQEAAAMNALTMAKERGEWVVFQNCHLGIPFLERLQEWAAEGVKGDHPDFRMFLTCVPTTEFPTTLLLRCLKLTNEPPDGMAASMRKAASWVSADVYDMYRRPEWRPLVQCLCYVHALLLERRRYGARGWTGVYQFSEGDFAASLAYLQNHFSSLGDDARRGAPVQWDGVRYMIGEIHYGGRVTISSDRAVLRATMEAFLRPERLEAGAFLCGELKKFPMQTFADVNAFRASVETEYAAEEPPQIVGLYANAETQHRARETAQLLHTMLSIQPRTVAAAGAATREAAVLEIVVGTLKRLPDPFTNHTLHSAHSRDGPTPRPLTVFFVLEAGRLNDVLERVFALLRDLKLALSGAIGLSTALGEAADSLFASQTPSALYALARTARTFNAWVSALLRRHEQLQEFLTKGFCVCYDISAFFSPQGFVNSVRQDVCRRHQPATDNWALDRVEPKFTVTKMLSAADVERPPEVGVYVSGLLLDGAAWDVAKQRLKAPSPKDTLKEMPVVHLSAQLASAASLAAMGGGEGAGPPQPADTAADAAQRKKDLTKQIMDQLLAGNTNISASMFRKMREQRDTDAAVAKVRFPLFIVPERGDSNYVCDVELSHDERDPSVWALRGVALLCQGE